MSTSSTSGPKVSDPPNDPPPAVSRLQKVPLCPENSVEECGCQRVHFKMGFYVKLGEGGFGEVFKALPLDDDGNPIEGRASAFKLINSVNVRFPMDLTNEMFRMIKQRLGGKHLPAEIANVHTMLYHPSTKTNQNPTVWVIMDYCNGGNLLEALNEDRRKQLKDSGVLPILVSQLGREIGRALRIFHSHGGIHFDVKAVNILLHHDSSDKEGGDRSDDGGVWQGGGAKRTHWPRFVLADNDMVFVVNPEFGSAENMDTEPPFCTKAFSPPEFQQAQCRGSTQSDIWSLGLVLDWVAFQVSGREGNWAVWWRPWQRERGRMWEERVKRIQEDLGGNKMLAEVIGEMIREDPSERPRAEEVERLFGQRLEDVNWEKLPHWTPEVIY